LIAISAEVLLLNLRAWQLREPLRLNARESLVTRGELTGWSIPVCVGIVSLAFAITLPAEQIQWSGWVYFSMIILVPLHDHYLKRRIREECGMRISESGERKWGKTNQEARRTGKKLTDQPKS
jgi:hypothetical protein